MLKLIPQENPEEIRKVTAKKAKRFMENRPRNKASGSGKTSAGAGAAAAGPGLNAGEIFYAEGPVAADTSVCCDANKTKKDYLCKIHRKMQAEARKDHSILKGACARLIQFIRKNGRSSKQEMMELIHGLQRSVLSLEREKQRAFIKERRKKKK